MSTCVCTHLEAVHDLRRDGDRSRCSHIDPQGPCPCTEFEASGRGVSGLETPTEGHPDPDWAQTLFDQRDAAIAAVNRVRAVLDARFQECPECDFIRIADIKAALVELPQPEVRRG